MLANQTTKTSGIRAASSLRTPSFLPTHAQTRAEIDHVEERFFASRSSEHEKTREVWPVGGGPNDVTTLVKAMAPSLHSNHHRPAAQALAKLLATCRNRNAHATHGHLGPIDFPRALPPLGASFDVASGGNYCLGVGKEVGCGPC